MTLTDWCKKKTKKWFITVFKWGTWVLGSLLLLFFLTVGVCAGILYFKQDAIKNMLMAELNHYLVAPISVENVEVGILKSFPLVSVVFEGVESKSRNPNDKEALFHAEEISLRFSLRDFLNGRFIIKEIVIEGGEFNLKRYPDLSNNYIIWKYNPKAKPISFHLRRVLSKNTFIRYRDLRSGLDVQFLCLNMQAKGDLYKNSQNFKLKGSYHLQKIASGSNIYLQDFTGKMDLTMGHHLKKQFFSISKGNLTLEGIKLDIKGSIFYDTDSPQKNTLNFNLSGKKLDLEKIFRWVPPSFKEKLEDYELGGLFDIRLALSGNYKYNQFGFSILYHCKKAKILHKKSGISITNLSTNGVFSNGKDHNLSSTHISCKQLSARIGSSGTLQGSAYLSNFKAPLIRFKGTLGGDIEEISRFLGQTNASVQVKGQAHLNIEYENTFSSFNIRNWSKAEIAKASCHALLNLQHFYLNMPQSHPFSISADSASVLFSAQTLTLYTCTLKLNQQPIRLRLHMENLLPYWLDEKENLYASAEVSASSVQLQDWAYLINNQKSSTAAPSPDSATFWNKKLLDHLYLDFSVKAGTVIDPKGPFHLVEAMVHYTPKSLQIDQLSFQAYGGALNGHIEVSFPTPSSSFLNVEMNGALDKVKIEQVFKSFENFNQKQITYKNLQGSLSTRFELALNMDNQGKVDPNSILFKSKVHIANGALHEMAALQKLARFTGEVDLNHIRFSDLENAIEIRNKTVYIPRMLINSSLLSLYFEGNHRFDNIVDYRIDLELSELLTQKRKKRALEQELGLIVSGSDKVHLPLLITGHISNPNIRYDFKASKVYTKEKFKSERESIREAFRKEAAYSRNQNPSRLEEDRQKKQWKEQEKGKFLIESEDSDEKPSKSTPSKTKAKKSDTLHSPTPFKVEWDE